MTEEDARARIAAQATREQRLALADRVIDNSGTSTSSRRRSTPYGRPSPSAAAAKKDAAE